MPAPVSAPPASALALLGGVPVGPVACPPYPQFTDRAIERVVELLRAGRTTGLNRTHSAEVVEAEAALSAWHGGRPVLGASSGHGALHLALAGLGIGPGDEVVTSPYTWGASVSCILHQGAIPVFADVDPDTGLLTAATVAAAIGPRTRAILAVHLYGQPFDGPGLRALADRHGLALIEDGSQAHGAEIAGKRVGEFGDAAAFSCMGGKLLATIEAGYVVFAREESYWQAALLGHHMGRSGDPGFPEELRPSADSLVYTYRSNPITSVLLTEQLKKLPAELAARRVNADHLRALLAPARFLRMPDYGPGVRPVYHLMSFNYDADAAGVSRDTFAAALKAEGLHVFAYVPAPVPDWPRLHWQDYRGPVTPWGENLRRAGVDYRGLALPGCRRKVARSLETRFDFPTPAPEIMELIAAIILKVEAGIDDLREWERTHGPAAAPRR